MTLLEARKVADEIVKSHNITHSDYQEIRADGEVKFVVLTVRIKVDPPPPQKKA